MKNSNTFPRLSPEQIRIFEKVGKVISFKEGEELIADGEKNFDFFVVTEGAINILDPTKEEPIIASHQPGEFTGDSDMLSNRASLFKAIGKEDGRAIRVSHDDLQEIIVQNPTLSDILIRAFLQRRDLIMEDGTSGLALIGSSNSPETFEIREFLSKNNYHYHWLDTDTEEEAQALLAQHKIELSETPVVISAKEKVFRKPSLAQIAECTGLSAQHSSEEYDLLIVGAGPGGLAASVYAASEGLNTITIDSIGPGGQAGRSSKIENYLGFPIGIAGGDLANRAYVQAQKFGCTVSVPFRAKTLHHRGLSFQLTLDNDDVIKAKSVIAATGAKYRKLDLHNIDHFLGRGIYYAATAMEMRNCMDKEVAIVGGGNSAGQAAMFLSQHVKHVHLYIRKDTLTSSMSTYLIERINKSDQITVHAETEVTKLEGDDALKSIEITHRPSAKKSNLSIEHLFLFIGAVPCSEWLTELICVDSKKFVYTGVHVKEEELQKRNWKINRKPFTLETCIPGLFAIGDVRYDSTKRVASAVGEGAMAVSYVHRYLAELQAKKEELQER